MSAFLSLNRRPPRANYRESLRPRVVPVPLFVSVADRRRFALVLGVWAAVATFARTAEAGPQTFVALEYEVAPDASGCPDVEEFRAAVARQLEYDPFRPAADRRVAVQIARKEIGFDGRIRWTDADGRWVGDRRLTSRRPDCGEIAASLAFSVAVQIQLLATLAPPEPPRAAAARTGRRPRTVVVPTAGARAAATRARAGRHPSGV